MQRERERENIPFSCWISSPGRYSFRSGVTKRIYEHNFSEFWQKQFHVTSVWVPKWSCLFSLRTVYKRMPHGQNDKSGSKERQLFFILGIRLFAGKFRRILPGNIWWNRNIVDLISVINVQTEQPWNGFYWTKVTSITHSNGPPKGTLQCAKSFVTWS